MDHGVDSILATDPTPKHCQVLASHIINWLTSLLCTMVR